MTDRLPALIDALRDELQHYGEMLALLDQQQESVVARAANDLLQTVSAINGHGSQIQQARERREQRRREVAGQLGLPPDAHFSDLIPRLPEDYRPLLQALVHENNELLSRVQQRARQNHLLLTRSLDLMQRFVNTLFGAGHTSTYDGNGGLIPPGLPVRSLYEAVV
ncbi:MAG: flagellar protein FlgN [Verrucomicrobia bacterium]|nr:flagellar protein FlgN [Verrucomicrobiota bacterium]